jgi:hypothetical protein
MRQITAKLWKFFFMSTDGISGHLYDSQSVVCEVATVQERELCVGWRFETKSVAQTQRNYRSQFNKQPSSDYAIRDWQRRFLGTGSVHGRERSGRPGVSDECVETIHASFVRSPTKSTRHKPHVASSICLRATIFENPEWTLWTHVLHTPSWYNALPIVFTVPKNDRRKT